MEQNYLVTWEMDIYAETPQEAAKQAWGHMRHPHSIANYFEVFDQDGKATTIDLEEQQS